MGAMMQYFQSLESDPRVSEISDERSTDDGYWVYLRPGFNWDGIRTVHEYTVADLRRAMREVVPD